MRKSGAAKPATKTGKLPEWNLADLYSGIDAPEVARDDGDFPLAWRRSYGQGRVFYTALGHFSETWLDERFQTMLLNALTWLGGQTGN